METETKNEKNFIKEEKIDEETKNWLKAELKQMGEASNFDGERLPSLELPENKNTTFEVDASKKFDEWIDPKDGTLKKIIPVAQGENKFVLWLNIKNPIYRQILEKVSKGQTKFTVFRTGLKQNTRYTIVEE